MTINDNIVLECKFEIAVQYICLKYFMSKEKDSIVERLKI